jgi:hypothetical protein
VNTAATTTANRWMTLAVIAVLPKSSPTLLGQQL